ncbi:Nuclear pore complex protein Nup93 [Halotydeus destructor]|nr:Nuclear pore complex protein Nup93 [Halotydeus destructor]
METMDATPFDDLVNQAEQLTAEFSDESTFPRVERNLKQLAEAGQQLWSRTALHAPKQTADVRASVLLGSKGYDLQKVTQQLDTLSSSKRTAQIETVTEADTQGFLKNERENAILKIVEDVKNATIGAVEKLYWERIGNDWEEEKLRILNSLVPESDRQGDTGLSRTLAGPSADFKTPQEEDKFIQSIWSDIRSKKSVDHLLGYINPSGSRMPGEIDRYQINPDAVVEKIARKCEEEGFFEEAIRLYDLANNHTKVVKIMNRLLRDVISIKHEAGSERDRFEKLALNLAERYASHGHRCSKDLVNVFYVLLDLMTFFSYYHKQSFNDALDTIERVNVVPLRKSEIELKVNEFQQLPEEVKHNMSEILLATMNILYAQYRETKTLVPQTVNKFGMASESVFREQRCSEIQEKARTLITYIGMIPYRMPGNTNAKIIQLEVLMH